MAKLDDIKSKQPDSRLTSLSTTFRPGQKRIALPTSKQLSSSVTENETSLQNAAIAPTLDARVHPPVDTQNSNLGDLEITLKEPGTTRHTNQAQLGTLTRHNQKQLNHLDSSIEMAAALKIESEKNTPQTQPGTTRHTLTSSEYRHFEGLNENSDLIRVSKTEKNAENDEVKLKVKESYNSAQTPGTTRHNPTHEPSTPKHNPTQIENFEEKANRKPGTTRHNSAPGPAQPGTPTRHNPAHTKLSNESHDRIHNLSGTSALILSFLCKSCLENGTNRVTISYKMLGELTGVKFSSIPTTCKRLRTAGFFKLSGSKGGAQAVRHFDFSDQLIKAFANEILNLKQIGINNRSPGTTRHTNPAQPDTWASTNASSMYVGNINNNTIHTEPPVAVAVSAPIEPAPWSELREVNFSPLNQWGIKTTIVDTFKKNKWVITREQLEDFIERFHRYMTESQYEERRAKIKNPYSFFLGAIKDIANGEPHSICDVKTEYEIQKEIALKNRNRQVEEYERILAAQQSRLNQVLDATFDSWVGTLTPEEQIKLVAPQAMAKPGSIAYKQLLKAYYTTNIWPQNERMLLNGPRA